MVYRIAGLNPAVVDHVDVHTAAWGFFLARGERYDGA